MYCNQVALLHNVIIISEVNEKFILIINIVLSPCAVPPATPSFTRSPPFPFALYRNEAIDFLLFVLWLAIECLFVQGAHK